MKSTEDLQSRLLRHLRQQDSDSDLRLAAFRAQSVELEHMALYLEIKAPAKDFPNFLYNALVKFDDPVAVRADEMVMMSINHQHIVRCPGAQVNGLNQSRLLQYLQRTVDSHPPDPGRLFSHERDQVIGGKMSAGLNQRVQDDLARRSESIALLS